METKPMKLTKETLKRIIIEELNNVSYTTDAGAQLGEFEDAANAAMIKLEKNSYSIDGFEEKAIEAHKDQPGEEVVYFQFESSVDGNPVTFKVTLAKNGEHTIEQ